MFEVPPVTGTPAGREPMNDASTYRVLEKVVAKLRVVATRPSTNDVKSLWSVPAPPAATSSSDQSEVVRVPGNTRCDENVAEFEVFELKLANVARPAQPAPTASASRIATPRRARRTCVHIDMGW